VDARFASRSVDLPWLDEQIARERDARVQTVFIRKAADSNYLQFCRDR